MNGHVLDKYEPGPDPAVAGSRIPEPPDCLLIQPPSSTKYDLSIDFDAATESRTVAGRIAAVIRAARNIQLISAMRSASWLDNDAQRMNRWAAFAESLSDQGETDGSPDTDEETTVLLGADAMMAVGRALAGSTVCHSILGALREDRRVAYGNVALAWATRDDEERGLTSFIECVETVIRVCEQYDSFMTDVDAAARKGMVSVDRDRCVATVYFEHTPGDVQTRTLSSPALARKPNSR